MKVKFVPINVELEIKPNQSVMKLAHENNVNINSVCNGMPSCAECRVRIVDGEYNVPPPSSKELSLIGTGYFIDQRRLSCQLYCFGDVTIDVSEQLEKNKEGSVPKKFLARANKEKAEDYNSIGDVLIEEDQALIKQAEVEAARETQTSETHHDLHPSERSRGDKGSNQNQKKFNKPSNQNFLKRSSGNKSSNNNSQKKRSSFNAKDSSLQKNRSETQNNSLKKSEGTEEKKSLRQFLNRNGGK